MQLVGTGIGHLTLPYNMDEEDAKFSVAMHDDLFPKCMLTNVTDDMSIWQPIPVTTSYVFDRTVPPSTTIRINPAEPIPHELGFIPSLR